MRNCIIKNGIVVNTILGYTEVNEGEILIPSDLANIGWLYDGENFTPPETGDILVTSRLVNEERDRRLSLGKDFNGIFVEGIESSARNLSDLAIFSLIRLTILNDSTSLTSYRDGNNETHSLDPSQIIQLWLSAAQYVQGIYQSSWDLKSQNPIPQDYKNDEYWT